MVEPAQEARVHRRVARPTPYVVVGCEPGNSTNGPDSQRFFFFTPIRHTPMDEHGFIRSIHRKLPPDIYAWKICDNYQGGVADAYYSRRGGRDLWVEYKYLKSLPKRPQTVLRFGLSELQKDWLKDRHLDGRTVVVIIGSPDGALILPGVDWQADVTCESFIRNAVATDDVVAYISRQTTTV